MRGKGTKLLGWGTWATNSLLHYIHVVLPSYLQYTYLPGILHNLCSSIQDISGLILLYCAHLKRSFLWANFVIKLCHQSLALSGFMMLLRQLGTEKNKVGSWRQWSSGQSSRKRPKFPSWNSELDDRSKLDFPVGGHFLLEFPVVLNSLRFWDFPVPSFQVFCMQQN